MAQQQYKSGDRLRHAARPEWGVGVVEHAEAIKQDGRDAHRLTLRFEHAGRKTINTAFAEVVDADKPLAAGPSALDDAMGATEPDASPPPLDQLAELPESTTDQLATTGQRFIATLEQYRFDDTPRGMIDWAIAQSRVHDPISHYGREELDLAFDRFIYKRDKHLRKLAEQLQREGQVDVLRDAIAKLDDRRKAAMRQALSG